MCGMGKILQYHMSKCVPPLCPTNLVDRARVVLMTPSSLCSQIATRVGFHGLYCPIGEDLKFGAFMALLPWVPTDLAPPNTIEPTSVSYGRGSYTPTIAFQDPDDETGTIPGKRGIDPSEYNTINKTYRFPSISPSVFGLMEDFPDVDVARIELLFPENSCIYASSMPRTGNIH